jgi:site-specific DNA-methyltransferase (adenine-specific)
MFWKIINDDCLNVLPKIKSNVIDCIVTDPPYGIEFMGKDWDKAVPSVEVWKQCLRVLKPGAFMFVMSSPRLDVLSQMAIRLQEAGFRIDFTPIFWAYASGFPKAINISKAVDKKLGFEPVEIGKAWRSQRGISEGWDRPWRERQRQTGDFSYPITKPASEQAKALDGSYGGFQPKPAVEVILVCMKPLSEKSYVEQALKNRKGITWLDDCRIPILKEEVDDYDFNRRGYHERYKGERIPYEGGWKPRNIKVEEVIKGRFPANLLVCDDILNDGEIRKSIGGKGDASKGALGDFVYGKYEKIHGEHAGGLGDVGSFSRYFDLDRWFEKTFEYLPENVKRTFPFLICPKADKSERDKGLEVFDKSDEVQPAGLVGAIQSGKERPRMPRANIHPTVKPIKLMSYLVTLGSRKGDIILDPFIGSGTTAIACKLLGRSCLGIEIEPLYCRIAEARLSAFPYQETIEKFFETLEYNLTDEDELLNLFEPQPLEAFFENINKNIEEPKLTLEEFLKNIENNII